MNKTEIRFYHLERRSLDQVLPGLIAKALETGRRVVVKAANDAEVTRLNDHLWTYDPGSFLPHGTKKEGFAADQPVWLTTQDENPNGANVLILTHGVETAIQDEFTLCCEILDGRDAAAIDAARLRWKEYKDKDFSVTYWQQGEKGWEKKSR